MSQFSGNTMQSGYSAHRWAYPTVQENRGRGHVRYTQEQKDEALRMLDDGWGSTTLARKLGITESTLNAWRRRRDAA